MLAPILLAAATEVFDALRYREIGPAIGGGRTPAVAGSNRNPSLYYAGGADGGVFKTTDGGASWVAVFDREPVAAIGAISIAPQDDRDVWVGTGESNPRNDAASGDGVYRTTDGGRTWRHLGLDDSAHISAISIDPRDRRVVAVGALGRVSADDAQRGVYVTRDGGAHWSRTLYAGPSSGVSSLVRVPGHPSTLFAGLWQVRRLPWRLDSGGPNGGIYRSDDNGASWRKVGGGLPAAPTGRIGLAAGTRGRIYAVIQSRAGDLWRSDDGGTSWKKMPHNAYVGARPFYFSSIFVDPANRDRAIAVGLTLSMTTDAGASFRPIATGGGWDYHAIWWSADGRRIINGSDEGVILSADGGAHFWQPYDLPFAQPYHVGLGPLDRASPYDYRVCVGLQDNNSWCGQSSPPNGIGVLNRDWYQVAPGDGMWAVVDPNDSNLIWSSSTSSDTGQVYLWDQRTQQAYDVSPDAESNGELAASALKYRFNWETPIAFVNDRIGMALVGGNVVFGSVDRGRSWAPQSGDLTRNDKNKQSETGGPISNDESGAEIYDTILAIASSKVWPPIVWATTDDGLVWISHTFGVYPWKNVSPPESLVPPWGRIMCVEPGRFAQGTAFIAVERHLLGDERPYILRTDDFGAHWRSIAGDLPPNQFVRSIRQDPRNASVLYAGTNRGVWVTFDGGGHWQSLRLNMPASAIYDLEVEPQADDLVVASHGRGVWIFDDLAALQQWGGTKANAVTLFAPRDAYRMWEWAPLNVFTDPVVPPNEFAGENPPYGAILTYYLPYAAKNVAIDVLDSQNRVVRRLEGDDVPKRVGMNRTSWDLHEEGPVKWSGTFEENRGPDEGAEVLPGRYTVRLTVDGAVSQQAVVVKADPRDPEAAAYGLRYQFLSLAYRELGTVDTMLDAIDARLRRASPAQARRLTAFRARLTYDPRNVEDLNGPARLREKLLDWISRLSTSFQAPTQPQRAALGSYMVELESLNAAYRQL